MRSVCCPVRRLVAGADQVRAKRHQQRRLQLASVHIHVAERRTAAARGRARINKALETYMPLNQDQMPFLRAAARCGWAAARWARSRVTSVHGLHANHRGMAEVSRGGPATSILPSAVASAQVR